VATGHEIKFSQQNSSLSLLTITQYKRAFFARMKRFIAHRKMPFFTSMQGD
jgi:hypothetical protein